MIEDVNKKEVEKGEIDKEGVRKRGEVGKKGVELRGDGGEGVGRWGEDIGNVVKYRGVPVAVGGEERGRDLTACERRGSRRCFAVDLDVCRVLTALSGAPCHVKRWVSHPYSPRNLSNVFVISSSMAAVVATKQ